MKHSGRRRTTAELWAQLRPESSRAVWGSTFVTVSAVGFGDAVLGEPRIEQSGLDEGSSSAGRRISIYRTVSLFIAADVLGLLALGVLPLVVRGMLSKREILPTLAEQDFSGITIGIVFFLFSQQLLGGYRTKKALSLGWCVGRLGMSLLATFSFLMMLAAALKVTGDYSRIWFFSWMVASLSLLPFLRAVMIARRRRALVNGAYVNKALAVGLVSPPLKQSDIRRITGGLSGRKRPCALIRSRSCNGS